MGRDPYGEVIAKHYAAFRPPLHQMILSLALPEKPKFEVGLDIGSGTGYSTMALAEYCDSVFGVEPSDAMRGSAIAHSSIRYLSGSGEDIPLEDSTVDIVTFAGALFYIDTSSLVPELNRVCRGECYLIVYDFKVLLEPVLAALEVTVVRPSDEYNYSANLSGIDGFNEIAVCRNQIQLSLSPIELSHVLLSSPEQYSALATKLEQVEPFDRLAQIVLAEGLSSVSVDIYYSTYKLSR